MNGALLAPQTKSTSAIANAAGIAAAPSTRMRRLYSDASLAHASPNGQIRVTQSRTPNRRVADHNCSGSDGLWSRSLDTHDPRYPIARRVQPPLRDGGAHPRVDTDGGAWAEAIRDADG